ncbi:MAG: hypothetical protein R3A80_09450 [Bdellovibrionota bacterium]
MPYITPTVRTNIALVGLRKLGLSVQFLALFFAGQALADPSTAGREIQETASAETSTQEPETLAELEFPQNPDLPDDAGEAT